MGSLVIFTKESVCFLKQDIGKRKKGGMCVLNVCEQN